MTQRVEVNVTLPSGMPAMMFIILSHVANPSLTSWGLFMVTAYSASVLLVQF